MVCSHKWVEKGSLFHLSALVFNLIWEIKNTASWYRQNICCVCCTDSSQHLNWMKYLKGSGIYMIFKHIMCKWLLDNSNIQQRSPVNLLRAMNLLWTGVRHLLSIPLVLVLKTSGCNKQCKRTKRLVTTENNTDWPWLKHRTYKLTCVQVQFWTCLCACAHTFSVCQTEITGSYCSSLNLYFALAAVEELVIVSLNYAPSAAALALDRHSQHYTAPTWEKPTPSAHTILKKDDKWEPESKYFSIEQICINSPCWLYP